MPDTKLFLSPNAPISRKHTISSLGWISDCVGHRHEGFRPDEWAGLFHETETISTERGKNLMLPISVCSQGLSLLVAPLVLSRSDVSAVLLNSPDSIV